MTVDVNLVHAQFARQVLDILVGFRVSPVLWKYLYNNKDNGLSAGRCQSPALRLVYENEMDKKNGAGISKTYKTIARFFSRNLEFNLSRELDENEVNGFLSKSSCFSHTLSIGSPKESVRGPSTPLNTSALLQLASNNLRLSPKDTMALCQVLYQDGHITYMRTENNKYSKEFLEVAGSHISKVYGDKFIGDLSKLENKNENNPHEAIRVTHIDMVELVGKYEGKILSLYKLLWKTTIESCMSDYKATLVESLITAPESLHYTRVVEIPMFSGWRIVADKINDPNEGNGLLHYFKSLASPIVAYNSIESHAAFHNKHSHYTEASLIRKLEDMGIGRPSTFASIVDTIQDRGYIKKRDLEGEKMLFAEYKLTGNQITKTEVEKNVGNERDKLVIEPIGIMISEFLALHFDGLFSYNYTSNMETMLDKATKDNWHEICLDCDTAIQSMIVPVKKATYKVDDNHDIIFTKNGPVLRDNTTSSLKSVNRDVVLDVDKLKTGNYTIGELEQVKERIIGEWEGNELSIANGRFGIFAKWGSDKKGISSIKKPFLEITLDDVKSLLVTTKTTDSNILRVLNNELSVRTGKYGAYIYYKRDNMAKPEFYNIKKFKESFTYCKEETLIQWICDTYKINICE
jgi:DNA topoisomerase-1